MEANARESRPGVSVVIPVLNEREGIAACLAGVRGIEGGGDVEVVVVDGDRSGSTLSAIDDPGVVTLTAPRGRARQMNAGAARARGEVLVFLHADTVLPGGALGEVAGALADGTVVGGAFAHGFDSPRRVYRLISTFVSYLTRWSRLPYGDQAIFLRRDYFERIGGFADIDIMEDQELVRRIRRRGDRIALLRSAVRTSPRRLEAEGVVRRILGNWTMRVMYTLGVPPRLLSRHYRPHGES